jgi:polyribonucleotide nucleotidyltransferase
MLTAEMRALAPDQARSRREQGVGAEAEQAALEQLKEENPDAYERPAVQEPPDEETETEES